MVRGSAPVRAKAVSARPPVDWLLLLAACLTAASVPLAVTAPAVALPFMLRDLGGSALQLAWVVNGYLLTFGSLSMLAGGVADRFGRRATWLAGLAAFTATTGFASLAPSLLWMDVARVVQGAGAAAALSAATSSLAQRFRGKDGAWAFSLIGSSFGVSLAFGPLVAGWLVSACGWRALFHVTAGLTLIASVLAFRTPADVRSTHPMRLDVAGAAWFTASIAAFTWGVLQAPGAGWSSAACLVPLAASAGLAGLFIRAERLASRPILDIALFRDRRFVGVQCLALALAFVYIVPVFLLPGRFMGVDGDSAMHAGLRMIALSAPLLVVPPFSGWISTRVDVASMAAAGLMLAAAGLLLVSRAVSGDSDAAVWPGMVIVGCGIGLPWGVVDGLAISMVPPSTAGMAAGFFNAVRITADGIAVACATALMSLRLASGFADRLPALAPAEARAIASIASTGDLAQVAHRLPQISGPGIAQVYATAFHFAFVALAAFAVLSAVLVFVLLKPRAAHRPATGPAV